MSISLSFPNPAFGWVYYLVLVGFLVAAAYHDLRALVIPKSISIVALAVGIIANVIRGIWIGDGGTEVWVLKGNGFLGGLDGLLFALAGAGLGFALFFVMWWILGTCGGGDVKMFTAVGAWVGPMGAIFLLIGTIVFVIVLSGFRIVAKLFTGGFRSTMRDYSAKEAPAHRRRDNGPARVTRKRLLGWSLPMTLSTALVLLWLCRADLLQMAVPPQQGDEIQAPAK